LDASSADRPIARALACDPDLRYGRRRAVRSRGRFA
jgi:hypothetical protein